MASHHARPANRRRKITATVAAVAVIGVAGGYGTYAAFSDTTELTGSAKAGTVQLNDAGADTRSFSVTGLLPGDAPSICFDVAAPSAGNTQGLDVTLTAARTGAAGATTADNALAGELTVGMESVPATGDVFALLNGPASANRILDRAEKCEETTFNPGPTPPTPLTVPAQTVTNVAALGTGHGSLQLAAGAKRRYRVTVTLPSSAPNTAQGGTATFSLTWKGTAQTTPPTP